MPATLPWSAEAAGIYQGSGSYGPLRRSVELEVAEVSVRVDAAQVSEQDAQQQLAGPLDIAGLGQLGRAAGRVVARMRASAAPRSKVIPSKIDELEIVARCRGVAARLVDLRATSAATNMDGCPELLDRTP